MTTSNPLYNLNSRRFRSAKFTRKPPTRYEEIREDPNEQRTKLIALSKSAIGHIEEYFFMIANKVKEIRKIQKMKFARDLPKKSAKTHLDELIDLKKQLYDVLCIIFQYNHGTMPFSFEGLDLSNEKLTKYRKQYKSLHDYFTTPNAAQS